MNSAERRRQRRIDQQRLERQALLQRSGGRPKSEALARIQNMRVEKKPVEHTFEIKVPDFDWTQLMPARTQWPSFTIRWEPVVSPPAVDAGLLESLKTAAPYKVQPKHQAPDYVEVITGWRAWAVVYSSEGLRLKALGADHVWEPKEQVKAICTQGREHPAPQMNCTCGVWSFKELDSLVAAIGSYSKIRVLGQVSLWGRVVETTNGYRAQYAYPSELWLLDDSLEELGLIYDVPVRKHSS